MYWKPRVQTNEVTEARQSHLLSLWPAPENKSQDGIGLKPPLDTSANCIFKIKHTAYLEGLLVWKQIRKILLEQKVTLENSRTVGAHYTAM